MAVAWGVYFPVTWAFFNFHILLCNYFGMVSQYICYCYWYRQTLKVAVSQSDIRKGFQGFLMSSVLDGAEQENSFMHQHGQRRVFNLSLFFTEWPTGSILTDTSQVKHEHAHEQVSHFLFSYKLKCLQTREQAIIHFVRGHFHAWLPPYTGCKEQASSGSSPFAYTKDISCVVPAFEGWTEQNKAMKEVQFICVWMAAHVPKALRSCSTSVVRTIAKEWEVKWNN